MWKPHTHTTLFNLCFRSERLSKKTYQKHFHHLWKPVAIKN